LSQWPCGRSQTERSLGGQAFSPPFALPFFASLGANVPSQLSAAVVEVPGGYRVDDASGKRLGYFYFDATATYRADALTEDEARRMAEDFAKLPDLQQKVEL
jgi:hypothetical protein